MILDYRPFKKNVTAGFDKFWPYSSCDVVGDPCRVIAGDVRISSYSDSRDLDP